MKSITIKRDGTYTEEEYIPREPTLEEQKVLAAQYLQDTDYKIIKCAEALLTNQEMPYSIEELIPTRQQARNIINK